MYEEDKELKALECAIAAFQSVNIDAAARMIRYLEARFVKDVKVVSHAAPVSTSPGG